MQSTQAVPRGTPTRPRRRELEAATDFIGLPPERCIELGFADQGASLNTAEVARRVSGLIADLRPNVVLTHAYEGGHPDHDAAAFAVHVVFAMLHKQEHVLPTLEEIACYHGGDREGTTSFQEFLPLAFVVAALPEIIGCSGVEFPALAEWSPLRGTSAPPSAREKIGPDGICPVLALPENCAMLSDALPASQVRNLRHTLSQALRAGMIEMEAATTASAPRLLEALFDLHAARWSERGQPGVLADPAVRDFHRQAVLALARAGLLRMYDVSIGGRLAAVYYGLGNGQRAHYYLGGYDPGLALLGPGVLAIGHAIEEAVREGTREFHFLRGREPYKYRWGAIDRPSWQRRFSWPGKAERKEEEWQPIGLRWTIGDVDSARLRGAAPVDLGCMAPVRIGCGPYRGGQFSDRRGGAGAHRRAARRVTWCTAGASPPMLHRYLDHGMAEGVAWKLAPLRCFPDRYELSLDNDCILWDMPAAMHAWLSDSDEPRCLVAADVELAHGAFTDMTRREPRNTGIRGLLPGYDPARPWPPCSTSTRCSSPRNWTSRAFRLPRSTGSDRPMWFRPTMWRFARRAGRKPRARTIGGPFRRLEQPSVAMALL